MLLFFRRLSYSLCKRINKSDSTMSTQEAPRVNHEQKAFASNPPQQTLEPLKPRHKAGIALLQRSNHGTEVLLVRQANGHWSLPKGKRKKGETIKQTGVRECLEETGREPQALRFVGWGINSRKHIRFYLWKSETHRLCSEQRGASRPRHSEILQSSWVALARARKMLKPWQANLLAKITSPTTTRHYNV